MGSRTERLLLEVAEDHGFTGARVDFGTGYGYHNPHDAGDIMVARPVTRTESQKVEDPSDQYLLTQNTYSELYLIEEKYKATDANKYLQENKKKIDPFIAFAEAAGAIPLFAGRWSSDLEWSPGPNHYVTDIRTIDRTPSGHISVKPETAKEWPTAEDFFRQV